MERKRQYMIEVSEEAYVLLREVTGTSLCSLKDVATKIIMAYFNDKAKKKGGK